MIWTMIFIQFRYDSQVWPWNKVQGHWILFTERHSVGDVRVRLGQEEKDMLRIRGYGRKDRQKDGWTDGQTDHNRAPAERSPNKLTSYGIEYIYILLKSFETSSGYMHLKHGFTI